MSKLPLLIGKRENGKLLRLPLDAVTQTFGVLGRRGSGKTNTAVVLVEELLQSRQAVVVIDPVGVWWGLRSSYDGKAAGFPVLIMGGEHGDVPLEATAGRAVAEFLVHDRVSTVLDLSLFGEAEMRRFVGDMAREFYRATREAVHVVIDEADEFAPQSGYTAEGSKCLGAIQNLVRRGRARGIGCTLITQRSAVINKSVLNMTECLVCLQMTAPQDIEAIDGWLKYHAAKDDRDTILRTLPGFQRGQAWVYSPGWLGELVRVQVRQRTTFDSSATPKAGETRRQPKTLAEIDLAKLGGRIQAAADQARANDPRELKRRVAELESELSRARAQPQVDQAAVEQAVRSREQELLEAFGGRERELLEALHEADQRLEQIREITAELGRPIRPWAAPAARPADAGVDTGQLRRELGNPARGRAGSGTRGPAPAGGSGLGRAERSLLTAIAQMDPRPTSRLRMSVLSGYSIKSSSFQNALGRLRSLGLVEGTGDDNRITAAGRAAANHVPPMPAEHALIAWWADRLGKAEGTLLRTIAAAHPHELSREQISEKSGYSATSSSFQNALGRLRGLGLVEKGSTRLAAEVMA